MQAKKKPVETKKAANMNVDLTPLNKVVEVYHPSPRKEGVKVNDVDELVDKFCNEPEILQHK